MMNFLDILRMSANNLWRRKLRTGLTVLGVVIGTASIIVMISLGLGLQQSMYKEAEQSGGLKSITVTAKRDESVGQNSKKKKEKHITDKVITQLSEIEHVQSASPVLTVMGTIQTGKYSAQVEVTGMGEDALAEQNLPIVSGKLPGKGNELEVLFGNMVLSSFMEKNANMFEAMFDESAMMPEIDLDKANLFFTVENSNSGATVAAADTGAAAPAQAEVGKKYLIKLSGVLKGGPTDWTSYGRNVYCNLDSLVYMLKKEQKGGVIPGQPQRTGGKPFPYLIYSSAKIKVDDTENIEAVMQQIKEMGYEANSNMEFINSSKKQSAMIQGVLGAIGAVSLLVAAIGITNTMMMSIYERTKEIGVIKVLGCGLQNIRQMFLIEAAIIGFLGGLVGNILSYTISFIVNRLMGNAGASLGISGNLSYIPVWLALSAMIFAVFIGMIAGYFPAKKAMSLSPLEAMSN